MLDGPLRPLHRRPIMSSLQRMIRRAIVRGATRVLPACSFIGAISVATIAPAQCPISFAPAVAYPAARGPSEVAVADINLDGKLDLVIGNLRYAGDDVSILLGSGDGRFGAAHTVAVLGSGLLRLVVADFNADG